MGLNHAFNREVADRLCLVIEKKIIFLYWKRNYLLLKNGYLLVKTTILHWRTWLSPAEKISSPIEKKSAISYRKTLLLPTEKSLFPAEERKYLLLNLRLLSHPGVIGCSPTLRLMAICSQLKLALRVGHAPLRFVVRPSDRRLERPVVRLQFIYVFYLPPAGRSCPV
jgi:hypothetical protein